MRGWATIVAVGLLVGATACNSLPKGSRLVTCKPIIRRGKVSWHEGGQTKIPLNRHGGEAIVWPVLVLQDARATLVIQFADKKLLNALKPDQIYTFAVVPPKKDERGMSFPTIAWVKKDGKRIYKAGD